MNTAALMLVLKIIAWCVLARAVLGFAANIHHDFTYSDSLKSKLDGLNGVQYKTKYGMLWVYLLSAIITIAATWGV